MKQFNNKYRRDFTTFLLSRVNFMYVSSYNKRRKGIEEIPPGNLLFFLTKECIRCALWNFFFRKFKSK